jgi:hypothetical protein
MLLETKLIEYHKLLNITKFKTSLLINQLSDKCTGVIGEKTINLYYSSVDNVYTLKASITGGNEDEPLITII